MFADINGTIKATGVTIVTTIDTPAPTTPFDRAHGLTADKAGSSIEFSNGSIQTSGIQSYGAVAGASTAIIKVIDSDIITLGDSSAAIQATNGASITASGGNLTTHGLGSTAVYGLGVGTTFNVSGANITTTGDAPTSGVGSHGVKAHDGGQGIVSDSTINTSSSSAVGAMVQSSIDSLGSSSLALHNVQVTSTATALYSLNSNNTLTSKMTVDGHSNIVSTGDGGGMAARANGAGASIDLNNSGELGVLSVTALGTDSSALNGGKITADKILIMAAQGNALSFEASTTTDNSTILLQNGSVATGKTAVAVKQGAVGVLNVNDSSLAATGGLGFDVDAGSLQAALTDSVFDVGATGHIANVRNAGSLDLSSNGTVLQGDIQTDATSTTNLTLNNAQWNSTADSVLTNLNNNIGSNIMLTQGSVGNTITVRGNYAGNGGGLTLDAALGDDSSATDKLIVNGNTSGSTVVNIVNIGGLGGATDKGIQVIQVDGQSAGDFKLGNRVVAGAYDYLLDKKSNDGGWYLNSKIDNTDGSTTPTYRPEVGAYLGNQSAANAMFMHTMHDRIGEPQFTNGYKAENKAPSVWMRVVGNHTDSKAASGSIDQDIDTTLVHASAELAQFGDGDSRLHLGVMGAYGQSKADAKSKGTGYTANGKVDGYSLGGYGTWFGNASEAKGPYVDAWVQFGWFDNEVNGQGLTKESYDSTNWIASVEAGYAFVASDRGSRQWMIEPQVQVAYNAYSADDHKEKNGTRINDSDAGGVITRLGARFYSKGANNVIQPFVETNWWHGSASNSLNFGGDVISANSPKDRFEVKAGLQGEVAKGVQLWGHIGTQIGSDNYSRYEGMVGVKNLF